MMRLFSAVCVGATLLWGAGFSSTGRASDRTGSDITITLEDITDVTGILAWQFEAPADLKPGEYLAMDWLFPSEDGKKSEWESSGLDFRDVPKGGSVKVFVWTDGWFERPVEERRGMKCCVKYRDTSGEIQKKYGTLKIPEGYTDLYSYMSSGAKLDGGWVLMMSKPLAEGEKYSKSCFLDFRYLTAEPKG